MCLIYLSKFLVDLTQKHWNWRFFWHQTLKQLQLMNSVLESLQLDKGISFLIFVETIFGIQGFTFFKVFEGLAKLTISCKSHSHKRVKNWISTVDSQSFMEILSCFIIFLLFVANISKTPPSRIMSHIIIKSLLKGSLCFCEILVIDVFMSAERVGIWILRIQLYGSCEEFQSLFMFFLKRETISHSNPCFRSV